jgi:hypothetical protein
VRLRPLTTWLRVAAVLLALLGARHAHATKVAILETPESSAALSEAVFRLQGELLAVGIEVEIASRPGPDARGTRATLEEICAQRHLDAIVDVIGVAGPEAMEVWAFEPKGGRLELWRVLPDPHAPSASVNLAIRTSETIRSNLVERGLLRREEAPESEAPPANDNAGSSPRPPSQGRASVGAGVALLTSFDGVGPAVMPLIRIGWDVGSSVRVQATAAGFGTRPTLRSAIGSAKVAQSFANLGLWRCFWCAGRISPFASLALGVERTSLSGAAVAPSVFHSVSSTGWLLEGGVGVAFRLSTSYFLSFAAHVQVVEPRAVIHFADEVVARSGRPNLALDLTLGLWP